MPDVKEEEAFLHRYVNTLKSVANLSRMREELVVTTTLQGKCQAGLETWKSCRRAFNVLCFALVLLVLCPSAQCRADL